MEGEPATVCCENFLPRKVHDPHADRHGQRINNDNHNRSRKQIEACDLTVLVT